MHTQIKKLVTTVPWITSMEDMDDTVTEKENAATDSSETQAG